MASKDSNGDGTNDAPDNSEDNFGLPDIEYKPLDQPSETSSPVAVGAAAPSSGYSGSSQEASSQGSSSDDSSMEEYQEPKSKAPVILGVVIVLVLLVAGYLIYNFVYKPKALAEKAKKEQLAKDLVLKKQQEAAAAAKKLEEDEKRRLEELAKATPAVGTIETLIIPTRRYYVIVSSDIDDDLLMDFAKKLSAKGISTKIIPPFGGKDGKQFYRLSIADHDSFSAAQSNADAVKGDYGSMVWVIRY